VNDETRVRLLKFRRNTVQMLFACVGAIESYDEVLDTTAHTALAAEIVDLDFSDTAPNPNFNPDGITKLNGLTLLKSKVSTITAL